MNKIINISNGDLILSINTNPVEMISLKKGDTEFLYQRDGSWAKTSPLLFPICGKLKYDSYIYESKIYKIPKHGFAQTHSTDKWEVKENTENKVIFSLSSNKELLEIYPFEFEFLFEFELKDSNNLNIKTTMINKSKTKELFYSLGHHPAFNTSKEGVIKFNKVEKMLDVFPNGFVDLETETYMTNEIKVNDVKWHPDMNPCVVKLESDKVVYKDNVREINFDITDFESMLLWSKDGGTKWLCFEPWNGLPDFVNEDINEISEKHGILSVKENESHTSNLLISLKTF
ncbi:hypothetical protein [Spiroplasma endosymbiont of Othius punctulatus]|uniref:aldose epimerase family protein n=1 Tax=Spiroplasma endosymbiont of Othius punctulatus TaxID=3066289 RepID=UPI0030CD581A